MKTIYLVRHGKAVVREINQPDFERVLAERGINDSEKIIATASEIIKSHKDTEIDYIAICDPQTLVDMKKVNRKALMALAVKVGKTRLIDNMILIP